MALLEYFKYKEPFPKPTWPLARVLLASAIVVHKPNFRAFGILDVIATFILALLLTLECFRPNCSYYYAHTFKFGFLTGFTLQHISNKTGTKLF